MMAQEGRNNFQVDDEIFQQKVNIVIFESPKSPSRTIFSQTKNKKKLFSFEI